MRASNFLQKYAIEVYHKPGKDYVVPDTLLRLVSLVYLLKSAELDFDYIPGFYYSVDDFDLLSYAYEFVSIIAEISPLFLQKLLDSYKSDLFYYLLAN